MKWLAHSVATLMGWRFVGSPPEESKSVVIGAPHTSNWDFMIFLAALHHWRLSVRFLVKDGLFRWGFGWFLRRWGGIPVGESGKGGLVKVVTEAFEAEDEMILLIAPEGTRAKVDAWKSGFWRIADAADVPVGMGFFDRSTKTAGFGPSSKVAGDPEAWMQRASEFYSGKTGIKDANRGPVVL